MRFHDDRYFERARGKSFSVFGELISFIHLIFQEKNSTLYIYLLFSLFGLLLLFNLLLYLSNLLTKLKKSKDFIIVKPVPIKFISKSSKINFLQ